MVKKIISKLYNNIRTELTSYQWYSFLSRRIGICTTDGRKSLKALTYLASSPALSRFFNRDKWPSKLVKRVQRKLTLNLIKRRYWNEKGRNPTVYLLIDGTVLPKRGEELHKVGLHYDTRTGDLRRSCPFKEENATIGAADKASQPAILSETGGRVLRW